MSTTGGTGITLWGSTDPASIHGYSTALEASTKNRIIASYPTLAARNNAYSALTLINRRGIVCWVDEIAGWCAHDGTDWRYLSQHHVIHGGSRPAAADAPANTTVDILLGPSITLPTGSRRLFITASTNVACLTTLGNGMYPAAIVSGPGISVTEGQMKCGALMFAGSTSTAARSWTVVVSGTVKYDLKGTDDTPVTKGAVRFTDSLISVMDMGPADG